MNHDAVRRRLSDYMEESLSPRVHRNVEAHLEACPACSEELHALARTVRLLRGLEAEEPPGPPGRLTAQVLERLEAGEGRPGWHASLSNALTGAWAAPLLTAGAGLALLLAVQTVEIEIGWPGAEPAPEGFAAAERPVAVSRTPAQRNAAATGFEVVASEVSPGAPRAASVGASLRTQCLRQPGTAACAAWHSWLLGLAVDEPRAFVLEMEAVPDAARSRWLGDLSRFAAHSGSAPRIAARLRQDGDPRAQLLAPHFERVSVGGSAGPGPR